MNVIKVVCNNMKPKCLIYPMKVVLKNSIITHREIYMVNIFRNNTCSFVDTTPIHHIEKENTHVKL